MKRQKKAVDREEMALLASVERGEWKSVKNVAQEIRRAKRYAQNTIAKTGRMNIRISPKDLYGLKVKALAEGMPYQSLVSSVIHKYLSGRLIEREQIP